MAQFLPIGATTAVSDDAMTNDGFSSTSPKSLRIESDDGVFVLSDAFAAKNAVNATPGLLAWWKDAVTEEISIWGRLIHTQEDIGHALLSLELDFGADLPSLTTQDAGLNQAMLAANQSQEDSTTWLPGSIANAFAVLSVESPALETAITVNAQWFDRVGSIGTLDLLGGCQPVAKSVLTTTQVPLALAGPYKMITIGIKAFSKCGGGGSSVGDPPPCPGDIDCDGIPDGEDPDIDGDGIPNISDPDVDGDGIPNGSDPDVDGDGLDNGNDPDIDGDGLDNSNDWDADGDGNPNGSDNDIDGDGEPNTTDPDDDGDGNPDITDPSPNGCTTNCSGACCNTTAGTCSLKSAASCSGPSEQFQNVTTVCNPNPCCPFGNNPTFPPGSANVSLKSLDNPPYVPGVWGSTTPDDLNVSIDATCDGTQWCAVVNGLNGIYTEWYRLLPTVSEVTGPPPGNTTQQNNCNQVSALKDLGNFTTFTLGWYILQAVIDHENVHAAHLLPALQNKTVAIEGFVESVCVPHTLGMTKIDAINAILASSLYRDDAFIDAFNAWSNNYAMLSNRDDDSSGPTETAERAVVNPMIATICAYNKSQCWPECGSGVCPARSTGACCDPSAGVCSIKTECDCDAVGGAYRGDNSSCGPPNICQGACCTANFSCVDTTTQACNLILQGSYQGDGTTCGSGVCSPVVPKAR